MLNEDNEYPVHLRSLIFDLIDDLMDDDQSDVLINLCLPYQAVHALKVPVNEQCHSPGELCSCFPPDYFSDWMLPCHRQHQASPPEQGSLKL